MNRESIQERSDVTIDDIHGDTTDDEHKQVEQYHRKNESGHGGEEPYPMLVEVTADDGTTPRERDQPDKASNGGDQPHDKTILVQCDEAQHSGDQIQHRPRAETMSDVCV